MTPLHLFHSTTNYQTINYMGFFKFINDFFKKEEYVPVVFNSGTTVKVLTTEYNNSMRTLESNLTIKLTELSKLFADKEKFLTQYNYFYDLKGGVIKNIEKARQQMLDAKEFVHCGDKAQKVASSLYDEYVRLSDTLVSINKEYEYFKGAYSITKREHDSLEGEIDRLRTKIDTLKANPVYATYIFKPFDTKLDTFSQLIIDDILCNTCREYKELSLDSIEYFIIGDLCNPIATPLYYMTYFSTQLHEVNVHCSLDNRLTLNNFITNKLEESVNCQSLTYLPVIVSMRIDRCDGCYRIKTITIANNGYFLKPIAHTAIHIDMNESFTNFTF